MANSLYTRGTRVIATRSSKKRDTIRTFLACIWAIHGGDGRQGTNIVGLSCCSGFRLVRQHHQGSGTTRSSEARTRTTSLSRVERHNEKERQGHHQRSISFLLPLLILGGGVGSVVECSIFIHHASSSRSFF